MIRTYSLIHRCLLASGLIALSLGSATLTAHADDNGIAISNVDTTNYPTTVIEVSAPAGLTGGTLTADSIVLTENQQPVSFQLEKVPNSGLEVVLLIDTSLSMKGNGISAARTSATNFLKALPPEVAVGVVTFDNTVSLISPLTTDRALLTTMIARLAARGETAMYDALAFGTGLFSGGTADRQFVLLSDGGDTVSKTSLADAVTIATGIRTNVIELAGSEPNPAALQQISAANTGTLTAATDPAGLNAAYLQVANSLINRYRLVFQSAATAAANYLIRLTTTAGPVELSTTASAPTTVVTPAPNGVPVTSATPNSVPGTQSAIPVAGAASSGSNRNSSDTLRLMGAAAIFLALTLLLLLVLPLEARRRRVAPLGPGRAETNTPPKNLGAGISGFVDRYLERRGHRRGLALELETAAISLRPGEFLVLTFVVALVVTLIMNSIAGVVGAAFSLVMTPLLIRAVLDGRAERRRRAFAEQLPDVLQVLVTSLRGGFGLPQALDAVANQSNEPAASEFKRVLFEIRIGRDPGEALTATAERMKSRDFDWVVSAIQINREVGGELALILETLGETVRERQKMRRQIRSLTAEGRISAYILIALPPLLVVAISVLNPGYFKPMSKAPGPVLIVMGVCMLLIGWVWMRRMIKAQL